MRISRRIVYLMVGIILVSMWGNILPEGLRIVAGYSGFPWWKYAVAYLFLIGPIVAGSVMIGRTIHQMVRHKRDMLFETPEEKRGRELKEIIKQYNKAQRNKKGEGKC